MDENYSGTGDFPDDVYLDEAVDLTWESADEDDPIKFEPGYN